MNVARTLYRLYLVQKDRKNMQEALRYRAEARTLRDSLAILSRRGPDLAHLNCDTEAGEVAFFDHLVPLASGRMFGVMNLDWQQQRKEGSVGGKARI